MTRIAVSSAETMAIEDTQHWLMQAVIGLNLCPFAKAVVVKKLVRYRVCLSAEPEAVLQCLREELLHLAHTPDRTRHHLAHCAALVPRLFGVQCFFVRLR